MAIHKIGFGGGCHWCTEAVFQALKGVSRVEQGFIASRAPDDQFSEAVIVHFDAAEIDLRTLIEIHLRTHASMSDHSMRGKYRSAVYVYDEEQAKSVSGHLDQLQRVFDQPLVTRVLHFVEFKASDPRFQNYIGKNADGPFCKRHIDPKLKLLREKFTEQVADVKRH